MEKESEPRVSHPEDSILPCPSLLLLWHLLQYYVYFTHIGQSIDLLASPAVLPIEEVITVEVTALCSHRRVLARRRHKG